MGRGTAAMIALDSARDEELYSPLTGGRYLLIGHDYRDQTGYSDLEVRKVGAQSFSYWLLDLNV